MSTIRILSLSDTEKAIDMRQVVPAIEAVYAMKSDSKGKLFPMVFHEFESGVADMDIKSGMLEDAGIFGLKLVSWFGNNHTLGIPLLSGTVMVFDLKTGVPKGILSAEHLTGMRTGAAGAVGSKFLANKNAENMLVVGAGHQATYQIAAHFVALGNIKHVTIHDPLDQTNALKLSLEMPDRLRVMGIENAASFRCEENLQKAVADSHIIVTVTPSRTPLIMKEWVQKGTHFSCVGADMPGKQEIDGNIFKDAVVFTDDLTQAFNAGETELPIKSGIIQKKDVREIGDLISGKNKGRRSADDITIFDSTGIALQDLMVAGLALKSAEVMNIGSIVDI